MQGASNFGVSSHKSHGSLSYHFSLHFIHLWGSTISDSIALSAIYLFTVNLFHFVSILERLDAENPPWREAGKVFISSVTKLLERLLDYRNVMQGDENRDKRMSCTVNLLNFYKNEIDRKEMYLRYAKRKCFMLNKERMTQYMLGVKPVIVHYFTDIFTSCTICIYKLKTTRKLDSH